MQITADFGDLVRIVCPHCARGIEVRYRPETTEYVHDINKGLSFSHSLCLANGLWLKYQDRKDAKAAVA